MSKRELKSLNVELTSDSRESRLRSGTHRTIVSIEKRTMGDHKGKTELEQLRAELARAQAQLTEQQDELTAARSKLADADSEAAWAKERVKELETELDTTTLRAEVEKLREVDAVRKEFDIERKQLRELDAARVTELKASMSTEKERLLKRVDELEKQQAEGLGAGVSPRSSASAPEVCMPGEEGGYDSAHSESDDEHEGSGGGDDPTHSGDGGHAHESAEGSTSGSHEPADSEDDDDGHSSVSTTGGSGVDVMQSVARLLEEQRKMMAAQVQAMAAHSIPPLRKFTGEDHILMKDVSSVGLNNLKIVQKWQAGAMNNVCSS